MEYGEFAQIIKYANHLVVLSGAGISTSSGIPDFRSTDTGLWARFDPVEFASLSTFRTHPARFFAWIKPLLNQILAASPNPAHLALSNIERAGIQTTILTQNIDGLHQAAGSKTVHELHGTMKTLTCSHCLSKFDTRDFIKSLLCDDQIPSCPFCDTTLKPDVILFQEQLPWKEWSIAQSSCRQCDVMLVVGASLEVLPVAKLPLLAIDHGARLLVINQSPTYVDDRADGVIYADLTVALPRLIDEIAIQA